MADREKVIKGLECCLTLDWPCGDCPYYSYEDIQELDCERNLRNDAIAMLKEQEAVKPVRDEKTGRCWLCGNCGMFVGFEDNDDNDPNEFDKFCRECGHPVLWEGR